MGRKKKLKIVDMSDSQKGLNIGVDKPRRGRPPKKKLIFGTVSVDGHGDIMKDNREKERIDEKDKKFLEQKDIYPAEKQDKTEQEVENIEVKDEDIFDENKILLIELDGKEKKVIAEDICQKIQDSINASSDLLTKLEKWNDMNEGIRDKSKDNDPWKDSANLRSGGVTVAIKGKVTRYMASIFGVKPFFIIDLGKGKEELSKKIEDWFQTILEKLIKIEKRAKNLFKITTKDGTGFLELYMDRCIEKDPLIKEYKTEQEFVDDFPDYKEAEISENIYNKYIDKLKSGTSIKIFTNSYKEIYNLPIFDTPDRSDIVIVPHNAKSVDKAIGICSRMWLNWDDIKRKEAQGLYFDVDLIEKNNKSDKKSIDTQKDNIEGKSGGFENDIRTTPIEFFKCLYNYDVNKDGLNEKCVITLAYKQKVITRIEYWYKNLFYIPHYIEERPNRIDGMSVAQTIENENDEMDDIKRIRINSGKMACSPGFKAKIGSDFDPTGQNWYPGVIFWLENPAEDVSEFNLTANFPELYTEQQILERDIERKTGLSSGMSGRESPTDPTAPASKTIALLQQSNLIINDDISTLRYSLEEMAYRMIDMCSMFLDDDDKYLKQFELTKEDLKIARESIVLNGISVNSNKDIRKQEYTSFYQLVRPEPIIAQNPDAVRNLLDNLFSVWEVDDSGILLTEEELKEKQIQMMKEAIKQMQEQEKMNKQVEFLKQQGRSDDEIKQILSRGDIMPVSSVEQESPVVSGQEQPIETGQEPELTSEQPVY